MLTGQGTIRIADFGLIKLAGSDTLTPDGRTVGTPAYIAPEQVSSHNVDSRADIFGLGAAFYHLFSGRMPFQADNTHDMLLMRMTQGRCGWKRRPDVPLPLCRTIARMMEIPARPALPDGRGRIGRPGQLRPVRRPAGLAHRCRTRAGRCTTAPAAQFPAAPPTDGSVAGGFQ